VKGNELMEIWDCRKDYEVFDIIHNLLVYFINDKDDGYRLVLCPEKQEIGGIVIKLNKDEIKKLMVAIGDLLADSLEWD
jgi:hypothetical protein